MPGIMDQLELAEDLRQASILIDDETSRSRQVINCQDPAQLSASTSRVSDEDIRVLKSKHAFLADFSDSFIRSTPICDLMKIESTALKAREIERAKDSEDKLSLNKTSLATAFTDVQAGRDNSTQQDSLEGHPAQL
jgi:hypothetical protein